MFNYQAILKAQALKNLGNKLDLPDYKLCIGQGENLATLPLLVDTESNFLNTLGSFNTVVKEEETYDKTVGELDNVSLSGEDFQTYYSKYFGKNTDGGV